MSKAAKGGSGSTVPLRGSASSRGWRSISRRSVARRCRRFPGWSFSTSTGWRPIRDRAVVGSGGGAADAGTRGSEARRGVDDRCRRPGAGRPSRPLAMLPSSVTSRALNAARPGSHRRQWHNDQRAPLQGGAAAGGVGGGGLLRQAPGHIPVLGTDRDAPTAASGTHERPPCSERAGMRCRRRGDGSEIADPRRRRHDLGRPQRMTMMPNSVAHMVANVDAPTSPGTG